MMACVQDATMIKTVHKIIPAMREPNASLGAVPVSVMNSVPTSKYAIITDVLLQKVIPAFQTLNVHQE